MDDPEALSHPLADVASSVRRWLNGRAAWGALALTSAVLFSVAALLALCADADPGRIMLHLMTLGESLGQPAWILALVALLIPSGRDRQLATSALAIWLVGVVLVAINAQLNIGT